MKKLSITLVATFLIALLGILPFFDRVMLVATAEGADLNVNPARGSFSVKKTFVVKVVVDNTSGSGINAAEGVLKFDNAYLSVTSVTKDNSIFNLWAVEPAHSNAEGTVTFGGGSTSAKNSGTVLNVTFSVKKAGKSDITFTSGSVLAADGKGTNVLGNLGKGSYTFIEGSAPTVTEDASPPPPPPPPASAGASTIPAPDISSPSHADPEKWYNNNNPEFTWKLFPSISDVNATLDEKTSSDPRGTKLGPVESKIYNGVRDGEWYFHIKFIGQAGVSKTIHRKVLIDTVPPESFAIDARVGDPTDPRPTLIWNATDTLSGIDRYEVKIDSGETITIKPENFTDNLYTMPHQGAGTHKVSVRAIDKAGNTTEATKEIAIQGIDAPKIERVTETVEEGAPLIASGSALPDATVHVKLRREVEGEERIELDGRVKTDEGGAWIYVNQNRFARGDWKLTARTIKKNGAESPFTEEKIVRVTRPPFLLTFGWFIILILAVIISALAVIVYYQRREFEKEKALAKREVAEMRDKMNKLFMVLKEEVEEKVLYLDAQMKAQEGPVQTEQVIEKLKEALDISESILGKEIQDIEKTIK